MVTGGRPWRTQATTADAMNDTRGGDRSGRRRRLLREAAQWRRTTGGDLMEEKEQLWRKNRWGKDKFGRKVALREETMENVYVYNL